MGKAQRDKGKRGEREAKRLLESFGFIILADTSAGLSTDDLVVQDSTQVLWSVEVKNTKLIDLPKFKKQAMTNCGKLKWMLICKLDNTNSWLVFRQGLKPEIWDA